MDRKGTTKNRTRPDRQKKRRFRGNQHTAEQDVEFASTSAKKLRSSENIDFPISKEFGYCILNFFAVFSTIASLVICKNCKSNIQFSQSSNRGLGFKIYVKCSCNEVYIDSSPIINKAYEINRRIVFVLRLLGVGREGLNLFCSLMDICHGVATKTYYACLENIYIATSEVYNFILKQAIEDEKEKNEEAGNVATCLTVSSDGITWKRRGFSSLFGVSTLVGKYSKKVVDAEIKSSFCQACNLWNKKKNDNINEYNEWYKTHEEMCTINHEDSAVKMEINAVLEMFLRSTEKHGVLYGKYIGDGVSKTFKEILNVNLNGDEAYTVVKKQCVGHNELLNSLIWTFAPKHHSGEKIVAIATFLAVIIFNEGYMSILKVMDIMGMTIGQQAEMYANLRNEARIIRLERCSTDLARDKRMTRREKRVTLQDFYEQEEDFLYGPGLAV